MPEVEYSCFIYIPDMRSDINRYNFSNTYCISDIDIKDWLLTTGILY